MSSVSSKTKTLLILAVFLGIILCLEKVCGIPNVISFFLREKKEVIFVKHFTFSAPDALKKWDEKVLHKKVDYTIESADDESYVHAISSRSCSGMHYDIKADINQRPVLSWKWRVKKFPDKKFPDDLLNKKEDDFAARIYVIFPAFFFTNSKALEYIWSKDLKVGTISSSPYSHNIKLIVAASGLNEGNKWILEERDIYEDYLSAFKAKPKLNVGTIAFMCDSDSTSSGAEAYFDDIKIFYKK